MPQLDKFTYFSQFFWLCLFFFTFYIFICNDGNGVLGISRILKLRNQLLSHRGKTILSKVRLGKNRSSDSSRFKVSAFATHYLIIFVVPKLGPVFSILSILQFLVGLKWGLLGNEIFHFGVGPDGVAPPALDLNERPPLHLLYADVESSDSQQARNNEMYAHLRRVQGITHDLEGECDIARRQALVDIMKWEVRSLQQHFRVFRHLDRLRDSQRAKVNEILDLFR
uniref:H(+)-transporting two-sector ATPase n=1 Tax=Mutarda arvensis TaxID=2982281 RepID=A0A1D6WKK2_MUTAR|nr:orf224 [Sinapis arvensis]AJR33073.1 orf224 [Sinapis arvensis]